MTPTGGSPNVCCLPVDCRHAAGAISSPVATHRPQPALEGQVLRVVGCLAILILAVGVAQAQQPAPGRWVLLYACDGRPQWMPYTRAQLLPYVAAIDSAGRPVRWFSNGAVILALYARSGRTFAPWTRKEPSTGSDWAEYLDCLLGPGGLFDRLDSALTDAEATLPRPSLYRVGVMIPYPGSSVGMTRFMNSDYDLATAQGRISAIDAYTREVVQRFAARRGTQLTLDGMYWLHEDAYPTDSGLVHAAANVVHRHGLRFLWVPYYGELAGGWASWRTLGFDEAWLQPNYFFNRNVPSTRLDSAVARVRSAGMGLEIEFDGRLLHDPAYGDRLLPYLSAITADSALQKGSIALYDGGGALGQLASSRNPLYHALYLLLAQVMQ